MIALACGSSTGSGDAPAPSGSNPAGASGSGSVPSGDARPPSGGAEGGGYRLPSPDVVDIVDAPPTPVVVVAPGGERVGHFTYRALPGIDVVTRPFEPLAGVRVDPQRRARRRTRWTVGLSIQTVADGSITEVSLPPSARITRPAWSPDGQRLAFSLAGAEGMELWVAEVGSATARRVGTFHVNDVLGRGFTWMPGSTALLVRQVSADAGPAPARPTVPSGPTVDDTAGKSATNRTYQDLLTGPDDARRFEYFATSQLAIVDLEGRERRLGAPALVSDADPLARRQVRAGRAAAPALLLRGALLPLRAGAGGARRQGQGRAPGGRPGGGGPGPHPGGADRPPPGALAGGAAGDPGVGRGARRRRPAARGRASRPGDEPRRALRRHPGGAPAGAASADGAVVDDQPRPAHRRRVRSRAPLADHAAASDRRARGRAAGALRSQQPRRLRRPRKSGHRDPPRRLRGGAGGRRPDVPVGAGGQPRRRPAVSRPLRPGHRAHRAADAVRGGHPHLVLGLRGGGPRRVAGAPGVGPRAPQLLRAGRGAGARAHPLPRSAPAAHRDPQADPLLRAAGWGGAVGHALSAPQLRGGAAAAAGHLGVSPRVQRREHRRPGPGGAPHLHPPVGDLAPDVPDPGLRGAERRGHAGGRRPRDDERHVPRADRLGGRGGDRRGGEVRGGRPRSRGGGRSLLWRLHDRQPAGPQRSVPGRHRPLGGRTTAASPPSASRASGVRCGRRPGSTPRSPPCSRPTASTSRCC